MPIRACPNGHTIIELCFHNEIISGIQPGMTLLPIVGLEYRRFLRSNWSIGGAVSWGQQHFISENRGLEIDHRVCAGGFQPISSCQLIVRCILFVSDLRCLHRGSGGRRRCARWQRTSFSGRRAFGPHLGLEANDTRQLGNIGRGGRVAVTWASLLKEADIVSNSGDINRTPLLTGYISFKMCSCGVSALASPRHSEVSGIQCNR